MTTKDVSLVIWGTGKQPTIITPQNTQDKNEPWPHTVKRDNYVNSAKASGADTCSPNIVQQSFDVWWKGPATMAADKCTLTWDSTKFNSDDFFFYIQGGCKDGATVIPFTFPQTFWNNIWINEGAIIIETTGSGDAITKKFRLKTGTGQMDRVAFYVTSKAGVTLDAFEKPNANAYNSWELNDDSKYYKVKADGNAADCQPYTVTDGSKTWTVATDSVTPLVKGVLNAQGKVANAQTALKELEDLKKKVDEKKLEAETHLQGVKSNLEKGLTFQSESKSILTSASTAGAKIGELFTYKGKISHLKYDIDEFVTSVDNARIAAVGVQESEMKHFTKLVTEKATTAKEAKDSCAVELKAVEEYISANPGTGSAELTQVQTYCNEATAASQSVDSLRTAIETA